MAKYNDTKFYWLQLKEDFFEDDAIQWLEEQEPNGRDYAYFYLKLCLKSLKSNGILIRKVGNILIPYDNKKLAELTKMDFDTVTVAMELLKKIGLVTILETGEIYINQLENLIGARSIGALKKQQQRLLSGQKVDICPPKIEIEIEKEIEKEIDDVFKIYEENFGTLSPTASEMLISLEETFTKQYVCEAMKRAIEQNKKSLAYVKGILMQWKDKSWEEIIKEKNKNNMKPKWLNKEIKKQEPTENELKEMEEMLNEFKD